MNLDNLTPLTKNSARGSNENFDLHHHAESNKFTVSEVIYGKLNLEDNGFTAYFDKENVALAIVPNEEAVSYKGKGKAFSSTEMSALFTEFKLEGNLSLTFIDTKNEIDYYGVSLKSEENSEEEVVADDVTDQVEMETKTEEV